MKYFSEKVMKKFLTPAEIEEFARVYAEAKNKKRKSPRPTTEEWAAYHEADVKKYKKVSDIKSKQGVYFRWGRMHEMEVKGIAMLPVPQPDMVQVEQ